MIKRIYTDYFMRSRVKEYKNVLSEVLSEGYEIIGVGDYYHRICTHGMAKSHKILVNRHDIDTDPGTARRMFEIERELGVGSTFYFRLTTLDISLMRHISEYGGEVGYHFEEVASYAKRNNIKTKAGIMARIEEIREEFKVNFRHIESRLGHPISNVASHGDFANRALGVTNHLVTDCNKIREELGIELEAYDEVLLSSFDIYIADRPPPVGFAPKGPIDAILAGHKKICMLTHPRQWHASWRDNTRENILRAYEGWKWGR